MGPHLRPNQALRSLLAEVGWTAAELAGAVNRAGAEIGLSLSYDRSSVAHWLAGTRPRGSAPELVAEALSRRLGRTVAPAEIGFVPAQATGTRTEPRAAPRGEPSPDIPETLRRLGGLPAAHAGSRARGSTDVTYRLADLDTPGFPELVADRPTRAGGEAKGTRIEPYEVEEAEAMAAVFDRVDKTFGGGHGRRALTAYLAVSLGPKLRRPCSPALRRRLLGAAGQLTYLCAFMCFDDNRHGLAQRYYLTALQLAGENGSASDYAMVLRGLSVQAGALGHTGEALRLAESAAASVSGPVLRQAFVHGQLAVALARDRSRHDALDALNRAERLFERAASPVDSPVGAYHRASLLHQQAVVRRHLGDHRGAVAAFVQSERYRPRGEVRSRAVVLAETAALQLQASRLTEAVETWHRFLDLYPGLSSGRVDRAMAEMHRGLRPYGNQPVARALLHRAARLAGRGAAAGSG